jgi:hypothetical protein
MERASRAKRDARRRAEAAAASGGKPGVDPLEGLEEFISRYVTPAEREVIREWSQEQRQVDMTRMLEDLGDYSESGIDGAPLPARHVEAYRAFVNAAMRLWSREWGDAPLDDFTDDDVGG